MGIAKSGRKIIEFVLNKIDEVNIMDVSLGPMWLKQKVTWALASS